MHSIFIRCLQYAEAALRRIVSLAQDARGPPGTYVLTSVPKNQPRWPQALGCFRPHMVSPIQRHPETLRAARSHTRGLLPALLRRHRQKERL
jgi:hypothetical protein